MARNKSKTPKFVWEPVPKFFSQKEKQSWWQEERRRWIDGHNGLTGMHYFYLSRIMIKDRVTGELFRPKYRDVDDFIFKMIEKSLAEERMLIVFKRREVGLSTIGGVPPMYYTQIKPGSTSLLTSIDKDRLFELYTQKVRVAYDHMAPEIQPNLKKYNETKQNVFLQLEVEGLNEYGHTFTTYSNINFKETVKNPKGFSGAGAIYGFMDEFPLHPKRNELLGSAKSCFMKGTKFKGLLLAGGTVENGISNESLNAMRDMYHNADKMGANVIFIPGWMGLDDFMDEYGNSNEELGTKWIQEERGRLWEMEDKIHYWNFVRNYPLVIEDILNSAGEGAISADIMKNLQTRKNELEIDKPPVENYDLEENSQGIITYKVNKSGKFRIYEHPQKGKTYRAGNDTIPWNNETAENSDDRSKNSIWIKCVETQTYVAYYTERSHDSDMIVSNMIVLQHYYGIEKECMLMIERNSSGVLREKYKAQGAYHLLAKEPRIFRNTAAKKVEVGWAKHQHTKTVAYEAFTNYLRKHWKNIYFKEIITSAENFLLKNDDDLDAIISCEIFDQDESRKESKKFAKRVEREFPVYVNVGGKIMVSIKKETYSVDDDGNKIIERGSHSGFGF